MIVKPFLTTNSAFTADPFDTGVNVPFDFDMEYSPRIEARFLAPTSELGWRARYWHFDAEADLTVGPTPLSVASTVGGVAFGDFDFAGSISYGLDLDVVDLEATHTTQNRTLAAGLRFARIDQQYTLAGTGGFGGGGEGGGGVVDVLLSSELEVYGVGPTLAYEWRKSSNWLEGLFWLAGARGSLLYGTKNVNTKYRRCRLRVHLRRGCPLLLG